MSRIKVDRITDKAGTGSPTLVNGMNVTGKSTMGDVVGAAATFNSITAGGGATFSANVSTSNLDVTGVSTFRSDLRLADSIVHLDDTNTKIRFPSADTITAETAGTERVVIKSDGKIGLGLNNPGLKLHIQDGALPSAPTPNGNCDVVIEGETSTGIQFLSGSQTQMRFGDADSTAAGSIIYRHSDDDFRLNHSNSGYLSIWDGSAENLRFTPNNEIGIAGANYGTSGQVLTSGGAGAAVQWATPSSSGWQVVSTHVLAGSTSYIDSTGWSNAYAEYKVVFDNVYRSGSFKIWFRVYTDSTSGSTGTLYTNSNYGYGTAYMRVDTTTNNVQANGWNNKASHILGQDYGYTYWSGHQTFPMKTNNDSIRHVWTGETRANYEHLYLGDSGFLTDSDQTKYVTGMRMDFATTGGILNTLYPTSGRVTILRLAV